MKSKVLLFNNKNILKWLAIFLLVFGFLFVIGGGVCYYYRDYYEKNGVKTFAQIESIIEKKVTVSFFDKNGYEITTELGSYSSSMHLGQFLVIYYLKDKPTKIVHPETFEVLTIVFSIIGFVILVSGLTCGIIFRSNQKQKNNEQVSIDN